MVGHEYVKWGLLSFSFDMSMTKFRKITKLFDRKYLSNDFDVISNQVALRLYNDIYFVLKNLFMWNYLENARFVLYFL